MVEDELAAFAGSALLARRARRDIFPPGMLAGDQVLDLLLVLFIADAKGERLTGRLALAKTGGSLEVGRRWIMYLTKVEYIVGDGVGDLDDVLTMTPLGLTKLEQWLGEARTHLDEAASSPVVD